MGEATDDQTALAGQLIQAARQMAASAETALGQGKPDVARLFQKKAAQYQDQARQIQRLYKICGN